MNATFCARPTANHRTVVPRPWGAGREERMDLTLLALGIGCIVAGFLLAVLGSWLRGRQTATATGTGEGIGELIVLALNELVSSVRRIVDGPSVADRVQGLGSALVWLGVALIGLYVVLALVGAV
jgi:hypothetical protein